jgi:hypothetical protein
MTWQDELTMALTRRQFFGRNAAGIGGMALASLPIRGFAATAGGTEINPKTGGLASLPHFAPKAKRVIYLHQSGAPSQLDLFDYKPNLRKLQGTDLPNSVRNGQRITGMTSGQATFPTAASIFAFHQHGKSGAWISDLLPHTGKIVDDIAIIRTVNTDAINHDPAITFIQAAASSRPPQHGRVVSYGLGSENQNPLAFVVMVSQPAASISISLFSRGYGAAAFCHPIIKASNSAPAAIPCYFSPTLPASAQPRAVRCWTAWRSSTRFAPRLTAIRKSIPASPSTKWRTACRLRCRIWSIFRKSRTALSSCTGRTRASRGLMLLIASSPAAWPSATCVSSSFISAVGTSTAICRGILRCNAKPWISRQRR